MATFRIIDSVPERDQEVVRSWVIAKDIPGSTEMWKHVLLIDMICAPDSPAREIPLYPFYFLNDMRKAAIEQALKDLQGAH